MSVSDQARAEWERVQRIEQAYHEVKDPERLLPVNLEYWRRVLAAAEARGLRLDPAARVLDVGCGGAGILLVAGGGEKVGVDPLMPFYLEKFPFLRQQPVDWRRGEAESFADPRPFDVVFSINMLDHTVEPRAAAANIAGLVAPGGSLVLVLNVHLTRFWRAYYERLYRWVDPPHPYHFHRDDVPRLFPGLRLLHRADIDHLWLDLKGHYEEHVVHKKERDRGKLLGKLVNPFLYPPNLSRVLLRRPVYRRRPEDRPLMATYLYLLARG